MNEANTCPVEDKSTLPWAIPLPEARVITAPELWAAILDPETKTKARLVAVFAAHASSHGLLGNNCPPEVREKVRKMSQ